jgi:RNase H-fold protein (predicted Holliday junction resolvase)
MTVTIADERRRVQKALQELRERERILKDIEQRLDRILRM